MKWVKNQNKYCRKYSNRIKLHWKRERNKLIKKSNRKTDCFAKVSCNPLLNKLPQDSMVVIKTIQMTFNYWAGNLNNIKKEAERDIYKESGESPRNEQIDEMIGRHPVRELWVGKALLEMLRRISAWIRKMWKIFE